MKKYMQDPLEIILRKMCEFVGTTYESINFKSNDWYLRYEWTIEQENQFKDWLYTYMKSNNHARTELMQFNINTKPYILKWIDSFMCNYGWKTKNL